MKHTRLISLLLVLSLMAALLAGCGSESTTPDTPSDSDSTVTDTPATPAEDGKDSTPADTSDSSDASGETEAPADTQDYTPIELPLVDEPVTVRYWWPSVAGLLTRDMGSAEDYRYFREMEERTGVHVEIEVPNDASTQFGIMMASEDYPDFIENFGMYYTAGLDNAIEEELVAPLEEYADSIPNIMRIVNSSEDLHRKVYTDDGHLAGIPTLSMRRYAATYNSGNWAGYVVRQDWLDEMDMDVPTTYDEMTDVLAGMKANHGDDAIPFQLSCYNGTFMFAMGSMFFSGYNISADWIQVDGEVKYSPMQDGWKEYLQLLNSWYEAGYLDPDLMSAVSLWTTAATCTTDQFGVFPIIYTHSADIVSVGTSEIPGYAITGIAPLKTSADAEEHVCVRGGIGGSVNSCIMADSDYIELIGQWWDYFFTPEGILLGNYGIEGETYTYNEDGNPEWIKEAFTSDDPAWNLSMIQYENLLYNTPGYIENDREYCMVDEAGMAMLDLWNRDSVGDWNYPSSATMTAKESEEYASIMNDINTYVQEVSSKLLIGDMSFDDYDNFISQLENMGIDRAIACKQAALDRYNAR